MNRNDRAQDPAAALALAGELRVVIGKLNRRLREVAHAGDLTDSQKSALLCLERDGPATVTTLARTLGMRPQSMGAIVAALEAAALLSGAPDPQDRRQTIFSLTPACLARVNAGRAARRDWLFHAIDDKLMASEQQELAAALLLLKRLVDA
jgi:DNA-binding MarR family transcriptional regulator